MKMVPANPPEGFEETLAWLNPDREKAADMYVQLRKDLSKLFSWKGCLDPDGLTDEVFDRVARKVTAVRPTYEGDPRLYFRAVANNVMKEYFRRIKTQVPLETVDLLKRHENENKHEDTQRSDCLQLCLQQLSKEKRDLILGYYAKEKKAKIEHRNALAQSSGIPVETLRVKVHRIRVRLEQCLEHCLKRE
jgi:RNA polymerase sigma factor (sigma-70 family)